MMKEISLNNPELKSILYEFSDWFYQQNIDGFVRESQKNEPYHECVSTEYLNRLIEKDAGHIGYPEHIRGLELSDKVLNQPEFFDFRDPVRNMMFHVTEFIGARNNSLTAFYPEDGYIGWHTNWNASGYNLIFSYSEKGGGSFKYLDPQTQEIVVLEDSKGEWTCKGGYFGSYDDKDNHFWHAAESNGSTRLTFAYIIPNEDMWLDAIEEIESL
jgi:hypothetical protein